MLFLERRTWELTSKGDNINRAHILFLRKSCTTKENAYTRCTLSTHFLGQEVHALQDLWWYGPGGGA